MTNYTELVERLNTRRIASPDLKPVGQWTRRMTEQDMCNSMSEASTAISTLEEENRMLREALEMAARTIEIINETMSEQGMGVSGNAVTVAEIARATLKGVEHG